MAGSAAQNAIDKDGSSAARRTAGRYTGAAVSGAAEGGTKGGAHGAAVGAAKNVAVEAAKDATKVTGGSPVAEPAKPGGDKKLGVGGTSYEKKDKNDEGMSTGAKVTTAGAAAAAPPATGLAMLMALLAWLKSMFFAAMAAIANAFAAFMAWVAGMVSAIVSVVTAPFMAIGTAVSNAIGFVIGGVVSAIVAPVTAVATAGIATVSIASLIMSLLGGLTDDRAQTDGKIDRSMADCSISESGGTRGDGGGGVVDANVEANAQKAYSVLKTWGMPDENIAGILGNWSEESGIDPTGVETVYNEPYQIGPRKQAIIDNDFHGITDHDKGGAGLGQWSDGRNTLLMDYAKSKNMNWYELELQLAFMAEGDNPSDVQVFKGMISESKGTPEDAAVYFHDKWERSADNASAVAERSTAARNWYGKMSGWTVDPNAAKKVDNISGGVLKGIEKGISKVSNRCKNGEGKGKGKGVAPKNGGMTKEEAQALIDLYNQEGDAFLDKRYGPGGGPGSCDDNHAMNCVSFSTYFVNKYTTFQQYPPGNGIETAGAIASMTGKELSSTPTPYSVGSGPGSGAAGHTLVVLGVNGDEVIVGEAGYCAFMGEVNIKSAADLAAKGWHFVDMADSMLPSDQVKTE